MIANLGFGFLMLALVIALYAIATAIYGIRARSPKFIESAKVAAEITFPLITLSILALLGLMLTQQFQYTYVFRSISQDMPLILRISALWGGQAGSLLFWVWLLAGVIALNFFLGRKNKQSPLIPWMVVITMILLAFFLFMALFLENPFERIWIFADGKLLSAFLQPAGTYPVFPTTGVGLNPLLRHFGMIIHPPLLYLGFVTLLIPFAYAASGLITGEVEKDRLRFTRGWTLAGWLFLSAGLVLGSRWSYDVLGWGGYWGWDPVEIAALMPWLTSTAFLHSLVMQERRDLFKHWNYSLILFTFCLVMLGTYLTRTGTLSSVHAFSQSSTDLVFLILISLTWIFSLGLLIRRWAVLAGEGEIRSVFSREGLFLFNNILFVCIFLVCLTGVLFPLFSQVFTGHQVTLSAQWYKSTTGPLFALLLLLMGIVPLSAWGASNAKRLGKSLWKPGLFSLLLPFCLVILGVRAWGGILALWLAALVVCVLVFDLAKTVWARRSARNEKIFPALIGLLRQDHRRYGGFLVHFGVVLMAVGIIGMEFFQTQTQVTLSLGDSTTFSGFSIKLTDLNTILTNDNRKITAALLTVIPDTGKPFPLIPRSDEYLAHEQSVAVPGLRSTAAGDLYIVLADWKSTAVPSATFRIFYNPLILWLWIGAIVLTLGGLFAFWPDKIVQKRELTA